MPRTQVITLKIQKTNIYYPSLIHNGAAEFFILMALIEQFVTLYYFTHYYFALLKL